MTSSVNWNNILPTPICRHLHRIQFQNTSILWPCKLVLCYDYITRIRLWIRLYGLHWNCFLIRRMLFNAKYRKRNYFRRKKYTQTHTIALIYCGFGVISSIFVYHLKCSVGVEWKSKPQVAYCFTFNHQTPQLPPPPCLISDSRCWVSLFDYISQIGTSAWQTHDACVPGLVYRKYI